MPSTSVKHDLTNIATVHLPLYKRQGFLGIASHLKRTKDFVSDKMYKKIRIIMYKRRIKSLLKSCKSHESIWPFNFLKELIYIGIFASTEKSPKMKILEYPHSNYRLNIRRF